MHSCKFSQQKFFVSSDVASRPVVLPAPRERLSHFDVQWGSADELFTPAYWALQSKQWAEAEPDHYKLGRNLEEEFLACILGGYGIPAELGDAAYQRLKSEKAENPSSLFSKEVVLGLLSKPFHVGGISRKYRFPIQKSEYISRSIKLLNTLDESEDDRVLRSQLVELPGVGLKTASWIVRNFRSSDEIAIIDVHILRVGRSVGIFPQHFTPEKDYLRLEELFLTFASDLGVRASILDSVIWMTARKLSETTLRRAAKNSAGSSSSELDDCQLALAL